MSSSSSGRGGGERRDRRRGERTDACLLWPSRTQSLSICDRGKEPGSWGAQLFAFSTAESRPGGGQGEDVPTCWAESKLVKSCFSALCSAAQ